VNGTLGAWSPMSRRLDVPLALAAWLLGFAWVARTGSWMPLAVAQVAVAARLVVADPVTRRLFIPRSVPIAIGFSGALISVVGTYALFGPLSQAVPVLATATRDLYGVLHAEGYRPWSLLTVVLIVVAAEEIVWRGRLFDQGGEERSRPLTWQVAQSLLYAAVYGFAHATSGSALLTFVAFALGAAWALMRITTGSLWPPFIAHALWDVAVLIVWPVLP
jgi:membrane protease YdiL (CAAX protease family)